MRKLSINIPTYNRCSFLIKNLNIIIRQLRDAHLQKHVEINISDNASSDGTETAVRDIIEKNSDISIRYLKQKSNLGPDRNFITAMKMGKGEYSILFGDDDFFEPCAISRAFELINSHKDVSFFLSNRISVNQDDLEIARIPFLRTDVDTEIFDFSLVNDGRAFLSLVCDHGGILSFISSVVYRTDILDDIGTYDERCTGSCYSFLYYWWSSLASGKKIMYVNKYLVRATTTGSTNNNYGDGLKRLLVDTEGLFTIADVVFNEKRSVFRRDFLAAVRRSIAYQRIAVCYFPSNSKDRERLLHSLSLCEYSLSDISFLNYIFTLRNGVKICLKNILPNKLSCFLRM